MMKAIIWTAVGLVTGFALGYLYAIAGMLSYTPAVYP